MADKKDQSTEKPKGRVAQKKTQTVRERAAASSAQKPKRIRNTAGKIRTPIKKAGSVGKKEYHLPLPDNRAGKILKKRIRFMPKFIREAYKEIKLVTWPNRKDTIRLTIAVFIFAIVFASLVGLLDFVLGELFQKFVIKP